MSNKAQDETALKLAVVEAALPSVAFDGWTKNVMEQAVKAAGLDGIDSYRLFFDDVANLVSAFRDWADVKMKEDVGYTDYINSASSEAVHSIQAGGGGKQWVQYRTTEKVVQSVLARLEVFKPYREVVRRTMAYYAMHPALAMEHCYKTVDEIWYMAGDKATDFNFYSKRALLAAVYGATLHYWLEDNSKDFADTEDFLRRRINDVLQIPKLKSKIGQAFNDAFGMFKKAN